MKVDKSKWEVKKLGEVCDIINGLWKGKKAPFIKVGVIRNTNFTKDCQLDLRDVAYLDVEQKQFQNRKLKKNDIIIEKSGGGPKQPVGRAVLFKEDYGDYSFSNFTSTLRIINSMVLQACYLHKFLYYFYVKGGTVDMQNHLTGIHNLDFKQYKMISIPVPSLPEQQAIESELDAIHSLITKYKEQLNDYDNLAKSIFNGMFGDVVSNDKGWERKKLGDVCRIFGRIGFRGYTKNDFVYSALEGCITLSPSNIDGFGMNYKKCSYISWFKYEQSPEIKIYDGDILIVKTGSSYGKCAIVSNLPHKATINPQFVVLKQITCDNIYLYRYLTTDFVQTQYDNFVGGAAIPTFSQAKLSKLLVSLPPLPLQQKFAARITAIEAQKDNVKQQIADLQTLFDSRMQYYFD
ncbi:MAG: restriction endonuclease subunit S [Prevotella sp.]|nr:restriction endonuclease subunit S [Prevotella sp.]